MKVCIIAEGSYPYITGGVSSWIHSLISNMPEHEFIIYAIGAQGSSKGKFKYKIPGNVSSISEVFLDSYLNQEAKWGKRYKLTNGEKLGLKSILEKDTNHWENLFQLFSSGKIDSVSNLLTSKDFFDIIQEICLDYYPFVPFTDLFWTVRSMVLPLFISINNPVPEADLYHSVSTGYAGVIGALGKYRFGKPFLLTEHGIYTREREEEIIKSNWVKGHFKDIWIQYFYNMSGCAYHAADDVICLFNKNREIQVEIGCLEDKISIIPNGVKAESYQDLPQVIKKEKGEIIIGAIVRVVPIKDIKTMLQSFAIVKREIPNAKFYIMGSTDEDDEYFEECQQLLNTLAIHDVIFTGSVDIMDYLPSIDLLVLSSISEGQPLAILEGMAAGVPFVATDVGSCKELLLGINDEYGHAGIVVPVMQYVQMAHSIILLCKQEEMRKKMGLSGQIRVTELYTSEKFIENYLSMYQKLVGKRWQE
jgi:polysaccharide biosynthesis protein PelF